MLHRRHHVPAQIFKKNSKINLCKHIIFVLCNVLEFDCVESIKNRYIENVEQVLNGKIVADKFRQEKTQKKPKRLFRDIVQEHQNFNQQQVCTLRYKTARSASCSSTKCKKKIARN